MNLSDLRKCKKRPFSYRLLKHEAGNLFDNRKNISNDSCK